MKNEKLFTRNFTFLVLGQVSSLFGNYILKFALSMYVLELTGSASIFAGLLAAATLPTILLSPLGGILADRANRRNIMVTLDFLSGFAVLCAVLLFSEQNAIWIISALLIALSVLGAFESPTVQACVPQMHTGDNIVRANAVVNQVAAIAALIAPILGGILYAAFGLERIMPVSVACFFLTAVFECFIRLEYTKYTGNDGILRIIKSDFLTSMRFIFKEQTNILWVLLLAAAANFLLVGIISIGLPFIIRTVLGLSAAHYGTAQSVLGLSVIIGSISVSFLATRLKTSKLHWALIVVGAAMIPAGVVFLLPVGAMVKYIIVVLSTFVLQFAACIFSIFALSIIQQKTPNEMIGKIMAYVATITMCAQPLGQMVYGVLFDNFSDSLYLILILTGLITCIIGISSKRTFSNLDNQRVI